MADLTPAQRRAQADEAASIARAAAALQDPTLEDALAMDLAELLAEHRARGVDIDVEQLRDAIQRSLGSDVLALNRGARMDAARVAALEEKLSKSLEQAARMVARDVVRRAAQTAITEADEREPDAQWYVWVSVLGKGVCESCGSRHGTVMRLDYWEGIEPGAGDTLCGERCRCRLLPCSAPPAGEGGLRREEFRDGVRE